MIFYYLLFNIKIFFLLFIIYFYLLFIIYYLLFIVYYFLEISSFWASRGRKF